MYRFIDTSKSDLNKRIITDIINKDLKSTVNKNIASAINEADKTLKESFTKNNFVRNPVDTGESMRKSNTSIINLIDKVDLSKKVFDFSMMASFTATKQRKFYENGWGSNAKYGLRNPREYHANTKGEDILKKLLKK